MKKKGLILFTLSVILIGSMYLTKPNDEDFKNFVTTSMKNNSSNFLKKWRNQIGHSIAGKLKTDDYHILTLNHYYFLGKRKRTFIGAFGYFVPIY